MILLDTSILVDYLRGKTTPLDKKSQKHKYAICGIVYAELLHGIQTKKEKALVQAALEELHWIEIDDTIWSIVGDNLNKLRKSGLTVPFQDAVIATLRIMNNISLLSGDMHFKKIKKVLPKLKLKK